MEIKWQDTTQLVVDRVNDIFKAATSWDFSHEVGFLAFLWEIKIPWDFVGFQGILQGKMGILIHSGNKWDFGISREKRVLHRLFEIFF